MSLLNDAFTQCQMLHKISSDDKLGSDTGTRWVRGATFDAAIVFDLSIEAATAQAQGVSSVYTVTTHRSKVLEYHEVFQRLEDGKIFRVTSDGDDKATPRSTALDMRQVSAEEYNPAGVT